MSFRNVAAVDDCLLFALIPRKSTTSSWGLLLEIAKTLPEARMVVQRIQSSEGGTMFNSSASGYASSRSVHVGAFPFYIVPQALVITHIIHAILRSRESRLWFWRTLLLISRPCQLKWKFGVIFNVLGILMCSSSSCFLISLVYGRFSRRNWSLLLESKNSRLQSNSVCYGT